MVEEDDKKEKERKQKVKSILRDIKIGKKKKAKEGIKALKVYGDDDVIRPLLSVWNEGSLSSELEEDIINFINDIKSSTSANIIMDALEDTEFQNIHLPLLMTIWSSKVDYSDHLTDFINIAVNNEFMMAFECLTIIENLNGPFDENQIMESKIILREYADTTEKNEKDKKQQIILSISQVIESFDQ